MENKNQLYRTTYIRNITLKDGSIIIYKNSGGYMNMRYGIPDERLREVDKWDELLKLEGYNENFKGYIDRKGRSWYQADYTDKHYNRCQKKVYKDEFDRAKSYLEFVTFKPKDVRMDDLVKGLNAEEFILFLKDNEINYMPNIR